MANEKTAPSANLPSAPPKANAPNWKAFVTAGLAPRSVFCLGYKPYHAHDGACHSFVKLTAADILRHTTDPDHNSGGGVQLVLRETARPWPGWDDLAASGVMVWDFRCEICDAVVPFNVQHIKNHMKSHRGKIRRVLPGGTFNLTIGFGEPTPDINETFEAE